MDIQDSWNEKEFDELGWHDCRVYGFQINSDKFQLSFDIDYILESKFDEYLVAECIITFENISELIFDIKMNDTLDFVLKDINRGYKRLTPNNKIFEYKYDLIFENGVISFYATNFLQSIMKTPEYSKSRDAKSRSKN